MSRAKAAVQIANELGLHLRAAAAFAKGKSIIAIVTLAAAKGSRVQIVADGSDADAAVAALVELVENRFGEDS